MLRWIAVLSTLVLSGCVTTREVVYRDRYYPDPGSQTAYYDEGGSDRYYSRDSSYYSPTYAGSGDYYYGSDYYAPASYLDYPAYYSLFWSLRIALAIGVRRAPGVSATSFETVHSTTNRPRGRSRAVQLATTLVPGHAVVSSVARTRARGRVTVVVTRRPSRPSYPKATWSPSISIGRSVPRAARL
jgi:hypothetical protein